MWNPFQSKSKKVTGQIIKIKINGMHCSSCALTIDDELEELAGVLAARTSYARSFTEVEYDPKQVDLAKISQVIQKLGYGVIRE